MELLAGQQHDHAVHAGGNARMRGRAVAEGVVHGGELGLHVFLAQAHQLKGLDHDLRVVVPHCAGGQLHAVADQVVLVGGRWSAGRSRPARPSAARPGRRWASRRGCGRTPARRIPRRFRTWGSPQSSRIRSCSSSMWPATGAPKRLDQSRRRSSERACFARPPAHDQRVGRQARAAGQAHPCMPETNLAMPPASSPLSSTLEPVALVAGLHLTRRRSSLSICLRVSLQSEMSITALTVLPSQRLEAAACKQGGRVLAGQVDAQVGLVGAVGLHRRLVGNLAERRAKKRCCRCRTWQRSAAARPPTRQTRLPAWRRPFPYPADRTRRANGRRGRPRRGSRAQSGNNGQSRRPSAAA